MHDRSELTLARLQRFMTELLPAARYRRRVPQRVDAWESPEGQVSFGAAKWRDYEPLEVGRHWGRPWGTTWLHLLGQVPDDWKPAADVETQIVVDLGFTDAFPGFQAEGTVWSAAGSVVKGIEPFNNHIPVPATPGGRFEFYIEAASNPTLPTTGASGGSVHMGDPATAGSEKLYVLRAVDLVQRDLTVAGLEADLITLGGLVRELPVGSPRRREILAALSDALDVVRLDDVRGSAAAARAALAGVLADPASGSAHRVIAVGHAHIDSAWLWPTRETRRKVARTFSNVLALMDSDPDFVFAASSAQHYQWLKQDYPELFERVRLRVDEGRFIPVGGMWVEADANMTGGESMARQFLYGTRFFLSEFGVETDEVWLPDTFGYSAGLPQIARLAGKKNFLTQKLSWNQTNKFPHHSFLWEGIDGSRLFTHFPPADTYNSVISAAELALSERQFDEGTANTSLLLFGYGDGGGGPTREMLEAARRVADLEGSPRVRLATPQAFFAEARAEYPDAPVWSGEMYLEMHRGTLTTQHRTKQGNRRSESLLREAELWATTAAVRKGAAYPSEALDRAWRLVLLQQFHDILPGSSIAWVHQEAEANYAELAAELELVIEASIRSLVGLGSRELVLNAGPFAVDGVPALAATMPNFPDPEKAPTRSRVGDTWVLANSRLRAVVDDRGLVTSLYDVQAERELVPPGRALGLLQVHADLPNNWDAWDIDAFYANSVTDLTVADSVTGQTERGRVSLEIRRRLGNSEILQRIHLSGSRPALDFEFEINWMERRKLLKLAFPLDVHAEHAASEVQFGHVQRPTHRNTSWDAARFETAAHRWIRVGESGYGVAIANESTYGWDISREAEEGRTFTTVRASLLRGAMFPDPSSDLGRHTFAYSLVLDADVTEAVAEGYRLNLGLRHARGGDEVAPLLTVDDQSVVVEAVKLAADDSGDVIVRLYESLGGRVNASVSFDFPVRTVTATDLLERDVAADWLAVQGQTARLSLRPFQIVTLRVKRG